MLPLHQKKLTELTEGVHKYDHPASGVRNPDNPSEILYEGQPTHGKGSLQNPSYPLHPSRNLQGHPRSQNIVPKHIQLYPAEQYFDSKPIPGSTSFLNDPTVKVNLAKNSPEEEKT